MYVVRAVGDSGGDGRPVAGDGDGDERQRDEEEGGRRGIRSNPPRGERGRRSDNPFQYSTERVSAALEGEWDRRLLQVHDRVVDESLDDTYVNSKRLDRQRPLDGHRFERAEVPGKCLEDRGDAAQNRFDRLSRRPSSDDSGAESS